MNVLSLPFFGLQVSLLLPRNLLNLCPYIALFSIWKCSLLTTKLHGCRFNNHNNLLIHIALNKQIYQQTKEKPNPWVCTEYVWTYFSFIIPQTLQYAILLPEIYTVLGIMRAWVQLICKSYSTSHNTSGLERPYRVQGQILSGKWGTILDADVHSLMWASLFSFYLFLSLYFVSKISPFLFPNSSMYRSTVFFKLMASFFNYNYCVYIGISICIHTYTHTTHNVVPLSWHWLHFILLVFAAVTGIVLTIKHLELKATNNNNNKMSCLFFWVCVTSLNMMFFSSTHLPEKFMILFIIIAK